MSDLFDKRGIPIAVGDVVKVFHFVGARRKKHFMYKQMIGTKKIGPRQESSYFQFSHLDMDGKYYLEAPDGRIMPDYEIVQSIKCDHEDRPRKQVRP